MKLNLDPIQVEFLAEEGDKILYCGRQIGKSTICSYDCGEYATHNKNKTILMIAPVERQSYALFEKTLNYLVENYPKLICDGKDRPTQTKIQLTNGTVIWCLPVGIGGVGIRFLTVHRLYGEEASRIPEDVWVAVTPMLLTTGGKTILLTTPAGKGTYASDVWNNKSGAFDSFKRFSASSEEIMQNRPISSTWTKEQREFALNKLKQDKARMSAMFYAQEYLGKEMDEFNQFFPTNLIKSCMTLHRQNVSSCGDSYLGVDVGRMGEDPSVFISGDKVNQDELNQNGMVVTRKTLLTDTATLIKNLNNEYNYRKIYIDTTGIGWGVFDILLSDDETKRKVVSIENISKSLDNEEKQFKTTMKIDLYINLKTLMESGKIHLYNEDEIFYSLSSITAIYEDGTLKIEGSDTHIAEALIRLAWCMKEKHLNLYYEWS
jgi:hypothetical protein